MCFGGSSVSNVKDDEVKQEPRIPTPVVQQRPPPQPDYGPPSKKLERRKAYGADAYKLVGDYLEDGQLKVMRNTKTSEEVLVKFVGTVPKEGIPKGLEREIINHRRLLHPNIVQFYEVFSLDDSLAIVSELPAGGVLSERIRQNGPVSEAQARSLFMNLLAGMAFCHETKIYHRDLRPENMFLDKQDGALVLKISGFGYSKSAVYDSAPRTKGMHAPLNIPPELIRGGAQQSAYDGSKVDVWGAATVLYFMLTGDHAFEDKSSPGELNRVVSNRIVKCEYTFPPGLDLSPECRDFVKKLFTPTPQERLTISDMYHTPWLTGVKLPRPVTRAVEAKQSDNEINDIVARTRARRQLNSQSSNRTNMPPPPAKYAPAERNPRIIDGIAEVQPDSERFQRPHNFK